MFPLWFSNNFFHVLKLEWCSRWRLVKDKRSHHTLNWGCDYISVLGALTPIYGKAIYWQSVWQQYGEMVWDLYECRKTYWFWYLKNFTWITETLYLCRQTKCIKMYEIKNCPFLWWGGNYTIKVLVNNTPRPSQNVQYFEDDIFN